MAMDQSTTANDKATAAPSSGLARCYLLLLKLAAEERIKHQKTSVNTKDRALTGSQTDG